MSDQQDSTLELPPVDTNPDPSQSTSGTSSKSNTPQLPLGTTQDQLNTLVSEIQDLIKDRKFDVSMVPEVIFTCCDLLKSMSKLSPMQEIGLIEAAVKTFIAKNDLLTDEETDLLITFVDAGLKGIYAISKATKTKKCCRC